MAGISFYDRDGDRISLHTWARYHNDPEYKRIAFQSLPHHRVSTVWLGVDHRFAGEGPPLIFETMVFNEAGDDVYCDRYATEAGALAGHDQIVALARDNRLPGSALHTAGR